MQNIYIKSLDGIRAIAVILVILFHWGYPSLTLSFGWLGVNLFFILSGFLITRILLKEKEGQTFSQYIKNFYVKRAYRIFPLYYAFILIISIYIIYLSVPFYSELLYKNILLLLTFTYNFTGVFNYHSFTSTIVPNAHYFFGHMWSLAVEEQFYLVFPFIIYFFSKPTIKKILLLTIIICPLIRLGLTEYLHSQNYAYPSILNLIYKASITQADALAMGACLAVFDFKYIENTKRWFTISFIFMLGFGLANVYFIKKSGLEIDWKSLGFESPTSLTNLFLYRFAYINTIANICFALLILTAIRNTPISGILNNNYLIYIGKISFGMYMFHTPILFIFKRYIIDFTNSNQIPIWEEIFFFMIYTATVIIISHLSFKYFESLFLNLKSRYTLSINKKMNYPVELNS